MNKSEMIANVAEKAGVTKSVALSVVNAIFDASRGGVIAGALGSGGKVSIPGFGTFESRHRAARTGRNPQTGASIMISAKNVPAFKAGKGLKDTVAGAV